MKAKGIAPLSISLLRPIILLLAALSIKNIISWVLMLQNGQLNRVILVATVVLVLVVVLLWVFEKKENVKGFFTTLLIWSAAAFLQDINGLFLIPNPNSSIVLNLNYLLTLLPFWFLLFYMFSYQKSYKTESEPEIDIIPLLGVLMIVWGIGNMISDLAINNELFFSSSILPLFQICAGIGILARHTFWGVFGAMSYTFLLILLEIVMIPLSSGILLLAMISKLIMPIVMVIILFRLANTSFNMSIGEAVVWVLKLFRKS